MTRPFDDPHDNLGPLDGGILIPVSCPCGGESTGFQLAVLYDTDADGTLSHSDLATRIETALSLKWDGKVPPGPLRPE